MRAGGASETPPIVVPALGTGQALLSLGRDYGRGLSPDNH